MLILADGPLKSSLYDDALPLQEFRVLPGRAYPCGLPRQACGHGARHAGRAARGPRSPQLLTAQAQTHPPQEGVRTIPKPNFVTGRVYYERLLMKKERKRKTVV